MINEVNFEEKSLILDFEYDRGKDNSNFPWPNQINLIFFYKLILKFSVEFIIGKVK